MSEVRIKEAVEEIQECILEGLSKDDDTDQELEDFDIRYERYRNNELNERYIGIFEKIEEKNLVYLYFGSIGEDDKWIWEMEIDTDDIDFHMLKYHR